MANFLDESGLNVLVSNIKDMVYYKSGDTYTVNTGRLILPGFIGSISNNKATMYFNLTLPKSFEKISSVSISTMPGFIRGVKGHLTGTSSKDFPALAISDSSNYSFTITRVGVNILQIVITCAVDADYFVAQTPVVFCSNNSGTRLSVTFS